jgi:hypothetical protein
LQLFGFSLVEGSADSMAKRVKREVRATASVEFPPIFHARTKGRSGWFTPRRFEAVFHTHRDGTPLITLRQYSRSTAARAAAPMEYTLPLFAYQHFTREVEIALDEALTSEAFPST